MNREPLTAQAGRLLSLTAALTDEPDFSVSGITLQKLKDSHREIARLMVLGMSQVEIADKVGISPNRISQISKEPIFQGFLMSLREQANKKVIDVRGRLADMAGKALDVMEELLADDKSSIKFNAAKDILDRAGYKPVEKVETLNANVALTPDELAKIRDDISRAKREGYVIARDEAEKPADEACHDL